jgi:hypothetical protein
MMSLLGGSSVVIPLRSEARLHILPGFEDEHSKDHAITNPKFSSLAFKIHNLFPGPTSRVCRSEERHQPHLAEHTYLCRYEPEDLQRIQALPFVRAANV